MALTLGQAVIELAVNSAKFRSDLNNAHRDFNRFVSGVQGIARGLATAIASVGFAALAREALQAGDQIAKMANRTGVGIEALQELTYAAQLSGIEVGDLEVSLRRFAVTMADAARGNSAEAVETFSRLGIAATTSAGQLRDVEDVLGDVADAIARIRNPTEQADLAIKAFGRSGTQLLPFLKEGRGGIEALRREARELGVVIDAETVKAVEAAQDELERMAAVLKADLVRAVALAVPALRELRSVFVDLASSARDFFKTFARDEDLGVADLEKRIEDVTRRLEALKSSALQLRPVPGGFIAPPRGAGNQDLIRQQEEELARLQALLEKAKARSAAANGPGASRGIVAALGLDDKTRDQMIKGWVNVVEEIEREDELLLKFLADNAEERARLDQEALDRSAAGWVAYAEDVEKLDEQLAKDHADAVEQRVKDDEDAAKRSADGWVAYAEAIYEADEALARINADRARPFADLADATRVATASADAFGESVDVVRVRHDALREAMVELIKQEREHTDEFKRLKQEYADQAALIAFKDAVSGIFDALDNAITTSIKGVLLGTQTIEDAFRNLGQNVGLSLVEQGVRKMLDGLEKAIQEFLDSEAFKTFIQFLVKLGIGLISGATTSSTPPTTTPTGGGTADFGSTGATPAGLSSLSAVNLKVEVVSPPGTPLSVDRTEQSTGPDGMKRLRLFLRSEMTAALGDGSMDRVMGSSFGVKRRGVSR